MDIVAGGSMRMGGFEKRASTLESIPRTASQVSSLGGTDVINPSRVYSFSRHCCCTSTFVVISISLNVYQSYLCNY